MTARTSAQHEASRGTRPPLTNPALIRDALAHSDSHCHRATAARFHVSLATITRWRKRRAAAVAQGEQWPTAADVEYWHQRQAPRARDRARLQRWKGRRGAAGGPLFVDATGTTRRLQALTALGHRYVDVAHHLGVTKARAGHLATGRFPVVHRDTAAAVAAVYDELSMTRGPSPRCRALAANRGWPPPLAWDEETIDNPNLQPAAPDADGQPDDVDELAIEAALDGHRVHLVATDLEAAIRLLRDAGHGPQAIATRLAIELPAVAATVKRLDKRDRRDAQRRDAAEREFDRLIETGVSPLPASEIASAAIRPRLAPAV